MCTKLSACQTRYQARYPDWWAYLKHRVSWPPVCRSDQPAPCPGAGKWSSSRLRTVGSGWAWSHFPAWTLDPTIAKPGQADQSRILARLIRLSMGHCSAPVMNRFSAPWQAGQGVPRCAFLVPRLGSQKGGSSAQGLGLGGRSGLGPGGGFFPDVGVFPVLVQRGYQWVGGVVAGEGVQEWFDDRWWGRW
jgi:hypothetical protein